MLLAWHVIWSNIYMGHTPITGSMVIIVVFVFHGRHYCHLFLIMKERKFIIVVVVFLFIRVVVIIFLFIRVTTRCSRRQDARSCAGKKWVVQGEKSWFWMKEILALDILWTPKVWMWEEKKCLQRHICIGHFLKAGAARKQSTSHRNQGPGGKILKVRNIQRSFFLHNFVVL